MYLISAWPGLRNEKEVYVCLFTSNDPEDGVLEREGVCLPRGELKWLLASACCVSHKSLISCDPCNVAVAKAMRHRHGYQSCSLYTSLTISSLPPSPSALPCLSTELNACLLSHSLLIGLWDWSQYWFWLFLTHPSSPEMLDWRAHCFLTSLFPCKMGNCLSGVGSGYWSHDVISILLSVHVSHARATCTTVCIKVNLLKTH